jgi:Kef-type K+ transport system membrane component KefB/GTPase SAR1 family protein
MYLIDYLQVETVQLFSPKTLAALGFIFLAAYAFGDLAYQFKLPKISGYLIAGIIFGPYSKFIFGTDLLSVFSLDVVNDIKLIDGLAVGLIALTAGGELRISELKPIFKGMTYVILFKLLFISTVIFAVVLFSAPYVPIFASQSFAVILAVAIFLAILMLGTSPAATIAVINETQSRGRMTNFVLGTAVLKDVLMVILLAFGISFAKLNFSGNAGFEWSLISTNIFNLFLSLGAGAVFGYLFVLYFRHVNAEKVLFILSSILIITEISNALHLDTLLVFIFIGFFVQNFSKFGHDFIDPIEKLSVPIYVVFFTIAGAGLNIEAFYLSYQIAILVFGVRILLIYISAKLGTKLANEPKPLQRNVWMGFISQSAVVIGLSVIILQKIPEINAVFNPIIIGIVGLNLLFGPISFKFALRRVKETADSKAEEKELKTESKLRKKITELESPPAKKLIKPNFEDESLNQRVEILRSKLVNIFLEFRNNFINKRSEGSIEFFYQITEKYIDEYQKLKTTFTKPKVSGKELKIHILNVQSDIADWFGDLCLKRKNIEKEILTAEHLLQRLFNELKEFCDEADEYIIVAQEEDKFVPKADDTIKIKIGKSLKRFNQRTRQVLGIKAPIKRKIPFIKLVKYYFDWQIPAEMEKIAFFVGMERLTVLQRVKKIYDDLTLNFEELLNLIAEHKDIEAVATIALDKLNDIHEKLKAEIRIVNDEITQSNQNINVRLEYAFANPYNDFLESVSKAGTVELSHRKFDFSKIYKKSLEAKESTLETIRFWVNYFLGYLGVSERDAKIYLLAGKVNTVIDDTMIRFSDAINESLRLITSDLLRMFKKINSEFSNDELIKIENSLKIKESVNVYRNELLLLLHERGITKLSNINKSKKFNTIITVLLENFSNLAQTCDPNIQVLDEKDFEIKETKTEYIPLKTLPFRAIVKSFLEKDLSREVSKINEIISSHLASSIYELKNVSNIISYHFTAAVDEIERNPKSDSELKKVLHDTILESSKLIKDKIKIWDREIDNLEREIEVGLTEKIYKSISRLKYIVTHEPTKYAAQYLEHEERLVKLKSFYFKIYDSILEKLLSAKKYFLSQYQELLRPIFKEVKQKVFEDFKDKSTIIYCYNQTIVDPKTYDALPFIYRKLFDYSSSEVTEFIVGRENEKDLMKQASQRAYNGLPGSVAIIGDAGTGKSSLINYFLKDYTSGENVFRLKFTISIDKERELLNNLIELFKLDYVHSFEELRAELLLSGQSHTVILEDIHKLFLRCYGGFNAVKKLLLLISETSHKIFWIVSITSHGWQLLNSFLIINNYFPFQIKTKNLSKDELKSALLSRHQTSGFDLEYLPSETTKLKRRFRHAFEAEEKKSILEDEFFNDLSEACQGNITSAIFYWLRSINSIKGNTLQLDPLKKIDFSFLQFYEVKQLLTLASLVCHGNLKIPEHQKIFNLSSDDSRAILNFLSTTNLVQYEVNQYQEKVFFINHAIYKPLEIELRRLNIFE